MASLPEGWNFAGLWENHEYDKGRDFTDEQIARADAIIMEYRQGDIHEHITLHGADDIDSVIDQIEDIDPDSYFE